MNDAQFLLDVNILIALLDEDHIHHGLVTKWFNLQGHHDWGVCAFTEAAFLRLMTRSKSGPRPIEEAISLLTRVAAHPGYRYWPIVERATTLIAPFAARIFGHQQITDACLLGLAVKENGVLVTMDKALSYLAGSQYRHNLLVLE